MTGPNQLRPEPGSDARVDDIQTDIEQTRKELGQTVEALTAKLDVKAQARHKVDDTKQRVAQRAQIVRENPVVPVAVLAAVVTIIGIVIWRRRR